MLNLNLDDFADYVVEAISIGIDANLRFKHRTCGYEEILPLGSDEFPLKYLMVKATEHHLEKHNADATRSK